jgi:primosomal protein N' (replication factor Y)
VLATFLRGGIEVVRQQHEPRTEGPSVVELLGPVASPIQKINRRTRWQLLLRSRSRKALRWLLAGLRPKLGFEGSGGGQTLAVVDVDPQNLL